VLEVKPQDVKPKPASGSAGPKARRRLPAGGVTIAEAARRTGVSVHTLRYYERAGLVVTPIDRTSGGRRRYRELDLKWIVICTKLRATGMPISGICRYAELVAAGPGQAGGDPGEPEDHRSQDRRLSGQSRCW